MANVTLERASYVLGYNDRDNPADLRTASGQALENLFPGSPNPIPRDGITAAGAVTSNTALCTIPFRRNGIDYLFFYDSSVGPSWKVSVADTSGFPSSVTTLGTFPSFTKGALNWTQVRDRVYIQPGANRESPLWILEWGEIEDDWVIRPAWMVNSADVLDGAATGAGSIPASSVIAVQSTFVRRTDADAFDGSGNAVVVDPSSGGVFLPGILESNPTRVSVVPESPGGAPFGVYITTNGVLSEADVPPGATHWRVFRTISVPSGTPEESLGLEKRWAIDLPISGPNSVWNGSAFEYLEGKSDAVMTGITDVLKVVGYNEVPPYGDIMLYRAGVLWIGNSSYPDDLIGRWYYSQLPLDVEHPTKWQSMFKTDEYYKDTSLENNDRGIGLAACGTDVMFLMQSSVWYLRDGDTDFEPLPLPNAPGAIGPYTTEDQRLHYLSVNGPYTVESRVPRALVDFTAAAVWPKDYLNVRGYFFDATIAARSFMWFFRETLWICDPDGAVLIGHHMPAQESGLGPLKVIPATIANAPLAYPAFLPRPIGETCYFARTGAGGAGLYFWRFLNPASKVDSGPAATGAYTMRAVSKRFYADAWKPTMMADLYELLFYASWKGAEAITLKVTGDSGVRFDKRVTSAALTQDNSMNQPDSSELSAALRQMVHVIFKEAESSVGRNFQVEWSRKNDTPFDFVTRGFSVILRTVPSWTPENVLIASDV